MNSLFDLVEAIGREFKFCAVSLEVRHDSIGVNIQRHFVKTGEKIFSYETPRRSYESLRDPIGSVLTTLKKRTGGIFTALETVSCEELDSDGGREDG